MRQPPERMPRVVAAAQATITHKGTSKRGMKPPSRRTRVDAHALLGVVGAVGKARPAAVTNWAARSPELAAGGRRAAGRGAGQRSWCRPRSQSGREHQGRQNLDDAGDLAIGQPGEAPGHVVAAHRDDHHAPTRPPTRAWDDDEGMPKYQVPRFQTMAPRRPQSRMEGSTGATPSRTTNLPMVLATAVPEQRPKKLEDAHHHHGRAGVMAREAITVATMLAASWKPLVGSKRRTTTTVAVASRTRCPRKSPGGPRGGLFLSDALVNYGTAPEGNMGSRLFSRRGRSRR